MSAQRNKRGGKRNKRGGPLTKSLSPSSISGKRKEGGRHLALHPKKKKRGWEILKGGKATTIFCRKRKRKRGRAESSPVVKKE